VVPHRYDETLHIKAPAEAVWTALTSPELIERWFGARPNAVDLKPGGTILFTHPPHGEIVAEIDTAQPPHVLTFRWPVIGPPGEHVRPGNSTEVTFAVRAEPDGSVLELSEVGFDELDGTDEDLAFRYNANSSGWPRMLEALAGEALALA
jgi:uncharacterized protein YndB with AHSA1/START domain